MSEIMPVPPSPRPPHEPPSPAPGHRERPPLPNGLFRSPFSRAYWCAAAEELKKPRMLAIAAVLIAVRVALKSVAIPVAPPALYIYLTFFVNALGAGIFGPVVALLAAAISDTIGAVLFPVGVYFFPFILTEMAGSFIFALFLYRAPHTKLRIVLSRFCVCFFVNIVIQSPIMLWYYAVVLGKSYALFDLPRICKNLVLFPFESILLILFFAVVDPISFRMGLTYEPPVRRQVTGRTIAFILSLFILGSAATGAYYIYDYNTRNRATDFSAAERAAFNQTLARQLGEEDCLVLVNTIKTRFGSHTETVTYTVYSLAEGSDELFDDEWSLKNSEAQKKDYLIQGEKRTVILDTSTLTPVSGTE